jgi:hypothetical protein
MSLLSVPHPPFGCVTRKPSICLGPEARHVSLSITPVIAAILGNGVANIYRMPTYPANLCPLFGFEFAGRSTATWVNARALGPRDPSDGDRATEAHP